MLSGLRTWVRRHAVLVGHSSPSGKLGGLVHAYVAAVLVVAAGGAAAVLLVGDLSLERPWLLPLLAALVALENVFSVRLQRRQHGETVAHEEALIVVTALLLSPASALLAFAGGVVVGQFALRAARLKAVFNVGQLVASAALAFLVVAAVSAAGDSDLRRVLAALLGVLAFSIANRTMVAGVLALSGAASFRDNLRDEIGPVALVWLGAVSVGLLAGLAGLAHLWTLPFAVAAMIVLTLAFSGHARARRERQTHTELVRSAAAAIFSVDQSGRVRSWNPEMERITGLAEAEAVDGPLAERLRSYRADGSVADLLSPSVLSQPGERETVRVEAAGGRERWLTLSRAMLPDGGMAFVAQDVTEQRAAEEAIRESEGRLRLALDAGRMGRWDWDLASGEVRWSENLERLFGLEPGAFSGGREEFLARVHPDDRDVVEQTIERGLSEGRYEVVHRIVRPDGSVRWVEGKGRVVRDEEGHPRGLTGVAFDISARKRAEALSALQRRVFEEISAGATLAAALERLMLLVEEQSEGARASVLLLDEDGMHLRHGAAPSLPHVFSEAVDGIVVGPQAGSCGTAVYRGEPVIVGDIASDPLWTDARELALGHGLRACWSTPLVGSDGDVLGTFAMYYGDSRLPTAADLELTEVASHVARIAIERARQEQRLERSEEKYRRLVEQLPLAVYAFTPADKGMDLRALPRYVGPQVEAMLGYSVDDWSDDPDLYSSIVHPDDRDRVRAEVHRARALGDRFRSEYRMVAKDGRVVWVHDEAAYVRDEAGRVVRAEGFLLDVTERKTLESSLLQAQKMDAVGQLAGGIAHDFNNLMSAVIGFGELVLHRLDEQDPARAQVEQIVRAGERAAALTDQLLAFSRKQMIQRRVLDLNSVVADSDRLLRRLIGEDVELTCVLDPAVGPVLADPLQLEQVVVNLAVNARDAMPTGGKLTIETANVELDIEYAGSHYDVEPGRYVVLAVTDTGVGMDAETQARIFEPFFTTKAEGKGTGLGLATVFGIVKQNGGTVSVYSEPGRGTTFKLFLPRAESHAELGAHEAAPHGPPRGSETVLLVEDEALVRNLEREILEQCGYVVLEAASPNRALEIAAAHPDSIHLLLTDVVMPELSGRELVERLSPARPEMKVLYASGYADDSVVRHGVLEAEVAFLTKPFTLASLAAKVREVLDAAPAPSAPSLKTAA